MLERDSCSATSGTESPVALGELVVMGFHQLATVYVTLPLVCATNPLVVVVICILK